MTGIEVPSPWAKLVEAVVLLLVVADVTVQPWGHASDSRWMGAVSLPLADGAGRVRFVGAGPAARDGQAGACMSSARLWPHLLLGPGDGGGRVTDARMAAGDPISHLSYLCNISCSRECHDGQPPTGGRIAVPKLVKSYAEGRRHHLARSERPAYQQIADALRKQMRDGTYPPGAKLPRESELRERGALRSKTVRAALDQLRAEGLVMGRPRCRLVRARAARAPAVVHRHRHIARVVSHPGPAGAHASRPNHGVPGAKLALVWPNGSGSTPAPW